MTTKTEKKLLTLNFSIGIPAVDEDGNLTTETKEIEIDPLNVNVPDHALKSQVALEEWVKKEYQDCWDYAPDLTYINIFTEDEKGFIFPYTK